LACSVTAHAASIVYVSNFNSNTITAYDAGSGASLGTVVTAGGETAGFNGLVVRPDGGFYVAGQIANNVIAYDAAGLLEQVFDPLNDGNLESPQALAMGPDGKLYVVSSGNDRILRYDPATGDFIDTFADLGAGGHLGPIDLAFGPDGNLYVTTFDEGRILKVDGSTGAVLGSTTAPPGVVFAAAAFGPDGAFYVDGLDPNTFEGGVYRYLPGSGQLSLFVPQGAGGLTSPAALAFGAHGHLLVANLVLDASFTDVGSTLLEFDGQTGTFIRTLVGAGNGLDVPFFATAHLDPVPEPPTWSLLSTGLVGLVLVAGRLLT
jgi:DNA-binding beta-propeller fold protein YncE